MPPGSFRFLVGTTSVASAFLQTWSRSSLALRLGLDDDKPRNKLAKCLTVE
jgi:hypothetical protein